MRRWLKRAGLTAFMAYRRIRPARGIPVLGYHSLDTSGSHISLAPERFRVQMETLRAAGYRGVSLAEGLPPTEKPPGGAERLAILTFDDGLANFLETAVPILLEFGFSATNFVPTDYIGRRAEWFPAYGMEALPMMDERMLTEAAQAGMDIQSHGCSHRRLADLSPADRLAEPRRSRERLEAILGRAVHLFCYPFGDVNAAFEQAVREAGYEAAVTVRQGLYRPETDPPLRLPRQNLDYLTIDDAETARRALRACLTGAFADYVNLRGRLRPGAPAQGTKPNVDGPTDARS